MLCQESRFPHRHYRARALCRGAAPQACTVSFPEPQPKGPWVSAVLLPPACAAPLPPSSSCSTCWDAVDKSLASCGTTTDSWGVPEQFYYRYYFFIPFCFLCGRRQSGGKKGVPGYQRGFGSLPTAGRPLLNIYRSATVLFRP